LLFDLEDDPGQMHAIQNPVVEKRFADALKEILKNLDAPKEQWMRLGLISEGA